MSKNIISQSINKGVPVFTPVIIRSADLISISDNPKEMDKFLQVPFREYIKFLHSLGPSADIEIFSTMQIDIDNDTLERHIIYSPNGLLSSIIYNLNIFDACKNVDSSNLHKVLDHKVGYYDIISNFSAEIEEKLDLLRGISNPSELRQHFPLLYNKYQRRLVVVNDLKKTFVTLSKMDRQRKRICIKQVNAQQKKINPNYDLETEIKKANTFTLQTFIEEYVAAIITLVKNFNKIVDYMLTNPINFDNVRGIDQQKLELYFASQFLVYAERFAVDDRQDYLYYLANYFNENIDAIQSNLEIAVGNNLSQNFGFLQMKNKDGLIISASDLYMHYRQLLIANPNLRAIDFSKLDFSGLTVQEVKKFMDVYLKDLSANWDFLAPDDRSYEDEIQEKIKTSGTSLTLEERMKRQERLLALFMKKKRLYDSSEPMFRIKGKNTFDGYIGHIYPNGRVVLDKLYADADSGKLADGHAVYAMGIQEFYELSRLSKSRIIKNKLCNRYIHRGNWADRILKQEILPENGTGALSEVKKFLLSNYVE